MASPLDTIKQGLADKFRDRDAEQLKQVATEQKSGKGSSLFNTDWGSVDRAVKRVRGVRKQTPAQGSLATPKTYFNEIEEAATPELRSLKDK